LPSSLARPSRIVTLTPNPNIDRTLTVPRVKLDTVLRALEVRQDAGGKGFNVARQLKALGSESLAMAFVGGDTGRAIAQMMHDGGVATRLVQVADETRLCIVVTEPDGATHLKVNEPGPTISVAEFDALLAAVADEARAGDLWVLAGSLPRGLPVDFYAQVIALLRTQGAHVLLDASGEALRAGVAARPFCAKPNLLELAEATGRPMETVADAAEGARLLCAGGIALVAVSMGPDGLLLAVAGAGKEPARIWHAQPPAIQALNSVGAGDAAVAGIAWALAAGHAPAEVARWAVACGTAAAQREGVTFGAHDEVAAVARQVRVEEIASQL
jgi:1-phosphofructokinase family hexose kinase